ncbi:MAG: ATP-dependent DNA helicase [Lachnospiraceae bacterium]|nr:ATP-dependent DNA helicase [Lachnospiraceae bacterium]
MTEVHVSVRHLVEFLLRSGDIDNLSGTGASDAMEAGSRIHKKIQKAAGSGYNAEVKMSVTVPYENFLICVEGRADGVIVEKSGITIDEIKGTYKKLDFIKEPKREHLAQAMCYAYMVLTKENLSEIGVQVTYCNFETEAVKRFRNTLTKEEIIAWFMEIMQEYAKWAKAEVEWKKIRDDSIEEMKFPFEYREGQEKLVGLCAETYESGNFLFMEAPTGCGKTVTTLYPAVREIRKSGIERIFYLTAKTITRTVAADTLAILRKNALRIKSIVLTAKEKICILDEPDCNPIACERAGGHYDRVNDAIYEVITSKEELSREIIEEYAKKHKVCPFEFSLDLSLFADVIICDYNYVYDPHVYLRRFFSEGNNGKYLFLTDEAHNLVDRAREMYSAVLAKEDMGALAAILEAELEHPRRLPIPVSYARQIAVTLHECEASFLKVKRKCDEGCYVYPDFNLFAPQLKALNRFTAVVQKVLETPERKRGGKLWKAILNYYFEVSHFQSMWELIGDEYKLYARLCEDGKTEVKLLCMDPGKILRSVNKRAAGGVMFSATLFPVEYYKDLLGGTSEDPEILAKSVFSKENRRILTAMDVTSRYDERTDDNYEKIAAYIYRTVKAKQGNYMIFFPSFDFAERVHRILYKKYAPVVFDVILQTEGMSEREREDFLAKFKKSGINDRYSEGKSEKNGNEDQLCLPGFAPAGAGSKRGKAIPIHKGLASVTRSVVGFCVLGGIFSEGIDLTGEDLIGVLVVGGGIPFVTKDRELMREYFDENAGRGYEYAYQIPGMNKILQAAGRLIRTEKDRGIILYLEKRFLKPEYTVLFPEHMLFEETVSLNTVSKHIAAFWNMQD